MSTLDFSLLMLLGLVVVAALVHVWAGRRVRAIDEEERAAAAARNRQ